MLTLPLHLVDLPVESHLWVFPVLGAAGGVGAAGQHGEHMDVVIRGDRIDERGLQQAIGSCGRRRSQGSGKLPGEVGLLDQENVQDSACVEWSTA